MAPHIIRLNAPRWRKNIAAFDYDWTLAKPLNGRTHAKDVDDRQWLRDSVPAVLQNYYKKGFAIMVFTNQSKPWKLDAIEAQLKELNIPMTIAIGIAEADRKPNTTMWTQVIGKREQEWNRKTSFFVGDAAGRPGDWSDSDALFAKAIGIKFKTPEEVFPYVETAVENHNMELKSGREAVVMIGYPGSGKSTLAKTAFPNYEVINGDALKTADRMTKAAQKVSSTASVIFDATNADVARRLVYIKWAQTQNLPIRAVWVDKTIDASMEAATHRETKGGPHIPRIAFYTFRKRFQEPTTEEGFDSIVKL